MSVRAATILAFLLIVSAPVVRAGGAVELNLPGLASSASTGHAGHVTGPLSIGPAGARHEIALPFAFLRVDYDDPDLGVDTCCHYDVARADLQWRVFRDAERVGPFLGVLARFSHLRGKDADTERPRRFSRQGVGVVVGVRIEPAWSERLFFGAAVHWGAFLDRAEERLANGAVDFAFFEPSENGEAHFMNLELLKVGYRFD